MAEILFPDTTFGPRGRYSMRHEATIPRRDRGPMKQLLNNSLRSLSPELHCQFAGTEELTTQLIAARGDAAVAAFRAIETQRLTEAECQGDIEPVRTAVYDAESGSEIRGAWEWYAIQFTTTRPRGLSWRPWPALHRLGLPASEWALICIDVLEHFLSGSGLLVDGVRHRIEEIRTFSLVSPFKTGYTEALAAYVAEIDTRGRDALNPLQVVKTATAWGGEDRSLTWAP